MRSPNALPTKQMWSPFFSSTLSAARAVVAKTNTVTKQSGFNFIFLLALKSIRRIKCWGECQSVLRRVHLNPSYRSAQILISCRVRSVGGHTIVTQGTGSVFVNYAKSRDTSRFVANCWSLSLVLSRELSAVVSLRVVADSIRSYKASGSAARQREAGGKFAW